MSVSVSKALKFTDNIKGKVLGATCSYMSAKIIGLVDEASDLKMLWSLKSDLMNMNLPSNILLWIGVALSVILYILSWVLKCVVRAQNPSGNFRKIMKEHTAAIIADLSEKTYSWGYNYCIHYARDHRGWSPESFFIGEYDDVKASFRNEEDGKLPGYSKSSFVAYCEKEPKVQAIIRKDEDRERYAVCHIKCNLNKNKPKVDVKLKKTSWVQLQYNWDYFRLLDVKMHKQIEGKANEEAIADALHRAFEGQGESFYINSFCLHLLVETKNGVLLSRISQTKANDYASTWAATIGEQIEESDFYVVRNDGSKFREDFVEQWTKRALEEEFGIDSERDYEDVVVPGSLKVLSVDMEADIYNVALTCVVKLDMTLKDFSENFRGRVDRLENYELIECSLEKIREILLGYPENQWEYHPSTYLRLLMFHRYKLGTNETNKLFCKDNKIIEKRL